MFDFSIANLPAPNPGQKTSGFTRLKDESLEDSDNLPTPDVLASEIAEDLEAAKQLFQSITSNLEPGVELEIH